jgi:hypothetical protein
MVPYSSGMTYDVESGGGGTPMELFLAGLRGWNEKIRQKAMGQAMA